MRALSNLINLNQPDLVLFVGEALVGNDAGARGAGSGFAGAGAECGARRWSGARRRGQQPPGPAPALFCPTTDPPSLLGCCFSA